MKKSIVQFVGQDEGQDLIEYALLGGIITAVGAALITALGARAFQLMDALRAAIAAP
jgi:Flp pilus assembly pilin Flp